MIQKSRARLIVVGLSLVVASASAFVWAVLWVPAIIAALTGAYLLVWATLGGARWCRSCKAFPIRR